MGEVVGETMVEMPVGCSSSVDAEDEEVRMYTGARYAGYSVSATAPVEAVAMEETESALSTLLLERPTQSSDTDVDSVAGVADAEEQQALDALLEEGVYIDNTYIPTPSEGDVEEDVKNHATFDATVAAGNDKSEAAEKTVLGSQEDASSFGEQMVTLPLSCCFECLILDDHR